jgi:transcriptional regulator with XRE-family HTH domain
MELRQRVGRNVGRYRRLRGLTIERLAIDAGVSYSYVGEIERGLRNPTIDIVERLAANLSVDAAALFEA